MSGHSKWHNIKLRKGKQDAQRGKLFTKLAREIIVAAKDGGGSPDSNLGLRMAIQKARDVSMPADNIKRAILRGTGEIEGVSYDEIYYEGYGPAGVAVIVKCLTDNRNRTVAEIRNMFSKTGGNMGESGTVSWMFDSKGLIQVSAKGTDEDTVMMATIDAGVEEITREEDIFDIICPPDAVGKVRDAATEAGLDVISFDRTMIPQTIVTINDAKEAGKVLRLMDLLDDNDDVQKTYANFDISDEIMQELLG